MNDQDFNDILRVAAASLISSEPPKEFQDAVSARAPLASFIDALVLHQPKLSSRSALERIANLNQGTIEDLNASAFQSYVISRTGVSELELQRCLREIETFRRVLEAVAREESVPLAARDEAGLTKQLVAASEIMKMLESSED